MPEVTGVQGCYTYGGEYADFEKADPARLAYVLGPSPSSIRIGFLRDSLNSQAGLFWRKLTNNSQLSESIRSVIETWEGEIIGIFQEITQWMPLTLCGVELSESLSSRLLRQLDVYNSQSVDGKPFIIQIDPFNLDSVSKFPVFRLQATRACPITIHNGEPIPVDQRIKSVPRRPDFIETDALDGNGASVDSQIGIVCDHIRRLNPSIIAITEDIIELGELTKCIIERIRDQFPDLKIAVHCNVASGSYQHWINQQRDVELFADFVEPLGTLFLDTRSQKFSGRSVGYQYDDDTCWPAFVVFQGSDEKITLSIPYALDLERYGDIGDKETPETRRACKALFFYHAQKYLQAIELELQGRKIVLDDLACPYIRYDLPVGIGTDLQLLAENYHGSDFLTKYIDDFFRQELLVELFDEICTAASGSSEKLPDSLRAMMWCSADMVCEQELREICDVMSALSAHFFDEYLEDGKLPTEQDLILGEDRLALIRNIVQRGYYELTSEYRDRINAFLDYRIELWKNSTNFSNGAPIGNYSRVFSYPFIDPFQTKNLKTESVSSVSMPFELKDEDRPEIKLVMVDENNREELIRVLQDSFDNGYGEAISRVTSPLTFPSNYEAVLLFSKRAIEYTHAFYYLIYEHDRPVGLINARGIKRLTDNDDIECTFGTVIFNPEDRGSGIGRFSKKLLFASLFEGGVDKISSKVLDENDPRVGRSLLALGAEITDEGLDPNGRPYKLYSLISPSLFQ